MNNISYTAVGGGKVFISSPINPWHVLGLPSSASREDVKQAFRNKISQCERQNRAKVSIANHILTSTADRYERRRGTDKFFIKKVDHFTLAACGDTRKLASKIQSRKNIVDDVDEHGRTLLYLACKSGFYDVCKLLLEKGASINKTQRDGSTPLHGAAYFGHPLVVGLLLEHGAGINIRNTWGHTALDETTIPKIKSLIQTASTDKISSLAATLKEKRLVKNVQFIEYNGEVIAKELIRDPASLDATTRAQWNNIFRNWETVWHGTRYMHLQSILKNGLLPSGSSGITPLKGHIRLDQEFGGIKNWAAAIFVSPSILYSGHAAYAERVISESKQWCVLVKALCQPNSYKSYDPTAFPRHKPIPGEPEEPEYRVPVSQENKQVILRVESSRSVVVRSLVFVRVSFLESEKIDFDQALKIFA